MTLHRSLHVITDGAGQYLCGIDRSEAIWTPMPTRAIQAGLSWINSTVAAERCQAMRKLYPDRPWGLALVELELKSGSGAWAATSVTSWVSDDRPVSEAVLETIG